MKIASTLLMGKNYSVTLRGEYKDGEDYLNEIVGALVAEKSPNPVVSVAAFALRLIGRRVLGGRTFELVPSLNPSNETFRHDDWHVSIHADRALKATVHQVVIEDRQPNLVPVFTGEVLSLNKRIGEVFT